jgi:DNA-binding PadR family transcriptional regulator
MACDHSNCFEHGPASVRAGDWRRFRYWKRWGRRQRWRSFIYDFMRRHRQDWGHWENWGPFASFTGGPRGRFFESGEARLAILSLLQEGPKHGYQLIKELEQRSGGLYRASAGTVYPTLQQLEDEQLVKSEEKEGRKVYALSPAGVAEVEREKENIARIWRRAEHWEDWGQWANPGAFPLFGPLGSVVKATFRAARWAGSSEERQKRVIEILENAKRAFKDLREE